MKTKPFDLETAKQGAKLVTRDGKPARIVNWDMNDVKYPIVALIETKCGTEDVCTYTNNGRCYSDDTDTIGDLFIIEEPQYVPYESAEEFMQEQRKHGWYIEMNDIYKPCTNKDREEKNVWYIAPTEVTNTTLFFANIGVNTDIRDIRYAELTNYQWADGTPCGKLKEE